MLKINNVQIRDADKPANKTRVYIFVKGETVLENLQNRRHRPVTVYKKEIIPQLKAHFPDGVKFSWSQKAGCSCGCSPGFIVHGDVGREIYVDLEVK